MYYLPTKLYNSINIEKIYTVHYFEYHKDFVFKGESHDFYELMYADQGEINVSVKGKDFVLQKNQITLFAPNEFHALHANGAVAPNTIIVSFEYNGKDLKKLAGKIFYVNEYVRSLLAGIIREAKKAYSNDLNDPTYRKLVKNKKTAPGNNSYGAEQMIGCYLQMLLLEFLRGGGYTARQASTMETNTHRNRFEEIKKWIDAHIDMSFTINDLCVEMMMNKSTVEQVFHEHTGMSAIAYCRTRKIKKAKQLLREDMLNISQISELLGFSSVHYFSRTFKQLEKVSPTEYAKSTQAIIDHSSWRNE